MLLKRSVLFEVSLLLSISLVCSVNYQEEYERGRHFRINSDNGGRENLQGAADSSGYNKQGSEKDDIPDFSKYFGASSHPVGAAANSGESSANSGYVAPIDFGQFFSGAFDGGSASNNKEVSKPTGGFNQGASNPDAGFVSADDFKASFAALASNDFGDYYDQSQNKPAAEKESYETKPGPNYSANRAPAQFSYENKGHKKGVATEVHDLTEKPPKQRAPKKYKKPSENPESGESSEYNSDVSYTYPSAESYYQPSAQTPVGKVADYNTGKSSSTVSQNPYTPGYYSKLAEAEAAVPTPELSPYEKFSFQPASSEYVSSVITPDTPYKPSYNKAPSTAVPNQEYQPSENVEKQLADNKNCKKIDKQIQSKDVKTGRYKRQSMNCFICQDPDTKSNFEQCTYTTDSAPKSYYASATNTYKATVPSASEPYRHKRYSDSEGKVDPYDLIKHDKYQSRPKAFDEKHYQPSKETAESNSDYQYTPSYKKEESKKSFSEQKADELIQKGGENCEKVQREEMTCMVCTSPETGGNYEQCSYSSAPAQQKYAYVREQKFDGPVPSDKSPQASHSSSSKTAQPTENTKQETKSEESPRYTYQSDFHRGREEPLPNYDSGDEEPKSSEKSENKEQAEDKQKESNRGSTRYQIPSHFEYQTSSSNKKPGGRGLDPSLYGGEEEEETEATQNQKKEEKSKKKNEDDYEYPALGEYKFKYFPDFLKEESETAESKVEPAKKDVEEVLAEFAKKDRSNCQKAEKNGMTCYLCTDKNGLQHEECMYISESAPKQSHVAYHEKQEVASKPSANTSQAQSTQTSANKEPVPAASEQMIQKIKYKAITPLHDEVKEAASNKNSKTEKAPKQEQASESRTEDDEVGNSERETEEKEATEDRKGKGKQKEEETDVPEPPTPEEFKVGEKEGAFSEETRPVYSKALGVTLPKYMLTKSESEAIFDEFVSSS